MKGRSMVFSITKWAFNNTIFSKVFPHDVQTYATSAHVTVACGWSENMGMMSRQKKRAPWRCEQKRMPRTDSVMKFLCTVYWHDVSLMCTLTSIRSNSYTSSHCNISNLVYFAKLNIVKIKEVTNKCLQLE